MLPRMPDVTITFLSDYGLQDEFVGVCHGVIAGICPLARVIDITHGIGRHDVSGGAVVLRRALAYMPVGVHIAVVDPDVGAPRRAVALRLADERVLVGPDNGLLWPAAEQAGGVVQAVEISRSSLRLEPVSATFHGRDVFAPVAAHLAAGVKLADAGDPLDPDLVVRLELPRARMEAGALVAEVVSIDRFGNAQLSASPVDLGHTGLKLGRAVELELASGPPVGARFFRTFADAQADELIVYEDAARALAVAVSHGSAAERLGLAVGDELRIRSA
jgi:S-adenosyl-L-methionine hydrolase (adenosine-forming)